MKAPLKHNEAVLICLLQHPNKWVPLPVIRAFTKEVCRTECYPVNSRSSDLKNNYGYPTENKTETEDGVKHSFYRINISEAEINVLRRLYKRGSIPKYSQVRASLKPVQKTMFDVRYD